MEQPGSKPSLLSSLQNGNRLVVKLFTCTMGWAPNKKDVLGLVPNKCHEEYGALVQQCWGSQGTSLGRDERLTLRSRWAASENFIPPNEQVVVKWRFLCGPGPPCTHLLPLLYFHQDVRQPEEGPYQNPYLDFSSYQNHEPNKPVFFYDKKRERDASIQSSPQLWILRTCSWSLNTLCIIFIDPSWCMESIDFRNRGKLPALKGTVC